MSGEFGLKRVLKLSDLVAIEVGTTVGAGIFSLTALAARLTGGSAPLAFLAAAVPIAFIMMTVAMLGSALPTVGGTYRYPSRMFSPVWATVGVWCYALGLVFGALPLYATECVHYLQSVWPGLPEKLSSFLLLTLFFFLNLFGITIAASVQALMVVLLVAALLVFGLLGLPYLERANFQPFFAGGPSGFILASCLLTFALQGSNSVIELGAEIRRPSRNIPLSLLISIPLVVLLYLLVSVTAVGVMEPERWAAFGKAANLTQPARLFMGRGLFLFFLVGGAMFAFTTTLNGTYMWATKSLLVVARDGFLPLSLARTSRRGTPALFLALLWAFSSLAVFLNASIEIFAAYATIGGMIIFIPTMIAALRLPRLAPEIYDHPGFRLRGPLLLVSAVIGILTSALLLLILLADLGQKSLWYPSLFLLWAILGFIYFSLRKKSIEKISGQDFSKMIAQDLKSMIASSRQLLRQTPPPK